LILGEGCIVACSPAFKTGSVVYEAQREVSGAVAGTNSGRHWLATFEAKADLITRFSDYSQYTELPAPPLFDACAKPANASSHNRLLTTEISNCYWGKDAAKRPLAAGQEPRKFEMGSIDHFVSYGRNASPAGAREGVNKIAEIASC
jgi:hypothetical protein